MHEANRKAWAYLRSKYPRYFEGTSVLEVGSFNVNGSVRQFFVPAHYRGVDWRAGPGVDVVCYAHNMSFEDRFDVVISASMLEHDPYWSLSIPAMVKHLKSDGILLLSWGAARNKPHEYQASPDGKFHSLPAWEVVNLLTSLGVFISDFRYEINVPGVVAADCCKSAGERGYGEVVLAGFLDERLMSNGVHVDAFVPEDCASFQPITQVR